MLENEDAPHASVSDGHAISQRAGRTGPSFWPAPTLCRPLAQQLCRWAGIIEHTTVLKINAITARAESGNELAHRFAAHAGAVDHQNGFEGFKLLKPTGDRTTWPGDAVAGRTSFEAWLR